MMKPQTVFVLHVDVGATIRNASHALCQRLGYTLAELCSLRLFDITPDLDLQSWAACQDMAQQHFQAAAIEIRLQGKDQLYWMNLTFSWVEAQNHFQVTLKDITSRKTAEKKSNQIMRYLMATFEQIPLGIVIADAPDGSIRLANAAALGVAGQAYTEVSHIPPGLHPTNWRTYHADGSPFASHDLPLLRAVQQGQSTQNLEFIIRMSDNQERKVLGNASPMLGKQGQIIGGILVFSDIGNQTQTQQQLHDNNERFRFLFEHAPDAYFIQSPDGIFIDGNLAVQNLLGYQIDELVGRPFSDFYHNHNESRQSDNPTDQTLPDNNHTKKNATELSLVRKDATLVDIELSQVPMDWKNNKFVLCMARDISDRKKTDQERENLEEQLRHSQKMEAVGRLAGGVAHDFNNLLTAIIGNVTLCRMDLAANLPIDELLDEVAQAASRAANLTQQLLTFSRKQFISTKSIDLNSLIQNFAKMLSRIIGEDIRLRLQLHKNLWPIKADSNQMEQLIANFAVNARDAMEEGGELVIETRNATLQSSYTEGSPDLRPGQYVILSVRDTGPGMDAKTMSQVFVPFFTTKEPGKGTGLGLATVYGIVKQHQGAIEVFSNPGQGTTFQVYIPKLEETAKPQAVEEDLPKGHETILVVEDESLVRKMTSKMLQNLGYQALTAADGQEALEVARKHGGKIDLVLSDVIMPNMTGKELSKRMERKYGKIKTLFTSGYTEDTIAQHGVLDEGVDFINKPYSQGTLAKKIREILDRKHLD